MIFTKINVHNCNAIKLLDFTKTENYMRKVVLIFVALNLVSINSFGARYPVETFPKEISKDCREGVANVYDECSDQSKIIEAALIKANQDEKSVLVVYGAEWCIWCHVFDKYVKGESRRFKYKWQFHDGDNMNWKMKEKENPNAEEEAVNLNKYVSENFVIAHVEGYHSPNGETAIAKTGFDTSKLKVLPYILVLDKNGKYVKDMLPYNSVEKLEIREDSGKEYRGFNRVILLRELKSLRESSINKNLTK